MKNTDGKVFSKVAGSACKYTKNNTPHRCFSRFLNITNGTKSHKTSHLGIDVVAEESLLWPASSTNEDFMKLR